MALVADDYFRQLQALLPPGPAWPKDDDAALTRLLQGLAQEFARVDARANQLLDEADPRSTTELLPDWERVAGLPSPCLVGVSQTISERRTALVAKLVRQGGQSRQFFIDLAASLGYTVTITEYHPWTVDSHVDDPLCGLDWSYVWQINSALNTVRYFTVDSGVDEPFATWGNVLLECTISLVKPAHTLVLFVYT